MAIDDDHSDGQAVRIPIVEERLRIDTERFEAGRVIVTTSVATNDVPIQESLASRSIEIERIPIG